MCTWNEVQSTTPVKTNSLVLIGLDIGPLFLTIVGNSIFITTLVCTKSLHRAANVFLGGLCISDLLVGVTAQPIFIFYNGILTVRADTVMTRQVARYAIAIVSGLSFLFASLVTGDRYFAICHPYAHQKHAHCKTYISVAVVASSSYAAITAACLLTREYFLEGLIAVFGICSLSAIAVAYTRIYLVILSKKRSTLNIGTLSDEERSRLRRQKKEKDRTLVIGVIIAFLLLCYLPMLVAVVTAIVLRREFCAHRERTTIISLDVSFLVLANSSINPLIYFIRCTEMRRAAINIFRKSRVHSLTG